MTDQDISTAAIDAAAPVADAAGEASGADAPAPVVETNTAAASEAGEASGAFAADAPVATAPASPPEVSPLSLVYGKDAEVAAWVAKQLGGDTSFDQPRAIGIERDGQLVAGAVYTHYSGSNICITVVTSVPDWGTSDIVAGLLRYPFNQLGCRRLTAIVPTVAAPTISFAHQLGFKTEGVARKAFGELDGVILGLLKEDAVAGGWL